MRPEDARYAALRGFGGVDQIKETCRDARGLTFLEGILQDVRFATRVLVKSPGFTAAAAITIAFGIGATTAIFAIVHGLLLRPLPYQDSQRLVAILSASPRFGGTPRVINSISDINAIQENAHSFEDSAYYAPSTMNLTGLDQPEQIYTSEVSASFFEILHAGLATGRFFVLDEFTQGHDTVVVLSNAFWESHFGGRPDILGNTISLDGISYTVVGIAAHGFDFGQWSPLKNQIWLPLVPRPFDTTSASHWASGRANMLARLRPGVTLGGANAELAGITANIRKDTTPIDKDFTLHARELTEWIVGDTGPVLLVLMGAVVVLLLIACANVANLLLSRSSRRQKEISVRISLGAGKGRIARQLLTESVVLALLGGLLGLLLAVGALACTALEAAAKKQVLA